MTPTPRPIATTDTCWSDEWRRAWPLLAPAAALAGTHDAADVKAACMAGRAQLWPAADAAGVTELAAYPRLRALRLWLAGGRRETLAGMLPAVEAFAARRGCTRIEILGRGGWERALPGFRRRAVLLVKEIG